MFQITQCPSNDEDQAGTTCTKALLEESMDPSASQGTSSNLTEPLIPNTWRWGDSTYLVITN